MHAHKIAREDEEYKECERIALEVEEYRKTEKEDTCASTE